MNIIRNDKLIKRNSRIATISMIGGLVILGAGMVISFRYADQFGISLAALMAGFILSQVGIYYSNRWGRRPRPDELIDQALKGMDSKYTLYHYLTPAAHVLLGPAGIWVLMPYYQRGTITYTKGRWRQRGGNWYLKIFAQENLGRPDLEVAAEVENLQSYLVKRSSGEVLPDIQSVMVFTHPKTTVEVSEEEEPPIPAVTLAKLKDFIRKSAKGKSLSIEKIKVIQDALSVLPAPDENTDKQKET
ncbi:MAG: hypothetical protein JXB15_15355 [Anaerolineales bacterium]|nr:hypothetical protein [Anaerolineales bacterium]